MSGEGAYRAAAMLARPVGPHVASRHLLQPTIYEHNSKYVARRQN